MSDRGAFGWNRRWLLVCSLAGLIGACGTDREATVSDGGGFEVTSDAGRDAGSKPVAQPDVCPPSNPYCDEKDPAGMQAPVCGNTPVDLDATGVNVMIAVDGSASMAPHWPRIKEAIARLRETHKDAAFGVHVFWGKVQDDWRQAREKANWCGDTEHKFLDVGPNSAEQLTTLMGEAPPGPSFFANLWETSPVIDPLDYYLRNATKLADPTRTNYLVFISDGNDNCFGSAFTNQQDKLLAYEKIAVELVKRDIRVLPIGFDAVSAARYNGMYGTTPPNTNRAVLGTLLANGGSGLSEVPTVDDPAKFADVLDQVGLRVRSCRFGIPAGDQEGAEKLNPFELRFTVNGKLIERDRTNTNGWNFVGGDIQQLELFGQACEAIRSGAPLRSQKTCAEDSCGSAAIEVKTKPRAVLYVLDSSASRIECADGSFNCLFYTDPINRTSFTFWETVQHALGQSLVAPINDDVAFGLQLFPAKNVGGLSCEVGNFPEIAPDYGVQIRIMSEMLEQLPFGRTPIVQALENIADVPGKLADPGVQGAVVMLTDGGDTCLAIPPEEMAQRLGAAAKSLHDRGIKTYAIRFGAPTGKTPEQEAQLREIVTNGGTAIIDPANPDLSPYIDAVDGTALNAALAELSDKLASCEITVGELPENADKAQANLYLNGVLVPQRTDGKVDGWGWKDGEQNAIELHGPACDEFKTSRKTSVIVEFGCTPIYVQ